MIPKQRHSISVEIHKLPRNPVYGATQRILMWNGNTVILFLKILDIIMVRYPLTSIDINEIVHLLFICNIHCYLVIVQQSSSNCCRNLNPIARPPIIVSNTLHPDRERSPYIVRSLMPHINSELTLTCTCISSNRTSKDDASIIFLFLSPNRF